LSKLKFLRKISSQKKYLIDFSNLRDNLIPYQNLNSSFSDLKKIIDNPHMGLPILFPKKLKYFKYNKKEELKLQKSIILEKIFLSENKDYKPYKNFIKSGTIYKNNLVINGKYLVIVNEITKFNKRSINTIREINNKYKTTCAFQTRNIPHSGHEEIIRYLLKKFDHVVINPIIGPKKKGDVNFEVLKEAYDYIINSKFKKKLSYVPIIANMFYAGPREAIHHSNIRKSIGFKNFVVGRDHAGAFNNYKPLDAHKLILKYKNKIKINIETHKGAYYCQDCKRISVNFNCKHKNFKNISGTEFRKKLERKKLFFFADKNLQKRLHNLKIKLFI